MATSLRSTWSAYTYAWWLTGDDEAAERAVRSALAGHDAGPTDPHALEPLLLAVRAAAVDRPTMCPASELALLHDSQGLPLDAAAAIASIDPSDATVELAHGRLEALHETVETIAHPERLGGLAVGNPADVAHARQCSGCATVRDALSEGRRELRGLPSPQPPDALLDAFEAAQRARPVGAATPQTGHTGGAVAASPSRPVGDQERRVQPATWLAAALLLAALVLLAIVATGLFGAP